MAQMAEGWQEQFSSGGIVWGLILTRLLGTPFIASKTPLSPGKIVRFLRGGWLSRAQKQKLPDLFKT